MKKKALTPKQRLFVHEYLVDKNATAAAKRAGYSVKTAYCQGQRLTKKAEVKAAIDAALERQVNKAIMTRDEMLAELSLIGRVDLKDYFDIDEGGGIRVKPFDEMPSGASRALESLEEFRTIRESADGKDSNVVNDRVKLKAHSKLGAIELLAKLQGYLKDRLDIPGLPELGQALYEISDKFLPKAGAAKSRSDEPK